MSYKDLVDKSMVAVIVGLACLILGFAIGRGLIPVSGLSTADAKAAYLQDSNF